MVCIFDIVLCFICFVIFFEIVLLVLIFWIILLKCFCWSFNDFSFKFLCNELFVSLNCFWILNYWGDFCFINCNFFVIFLGRFEKFLSVMIFFWENKLIVNVFVYLLEVLLIDVLIDNKELFIYSSFLMEFCSWNNCVCMLFIV